MVQMFFIISVLSFSTLSLFANGIFNTVLAKFILLKPEPSDGEWGEILQTVILLWLWLKSWKTRPVSLLKERLKKQWTRLTAKSRSIWWSFLVNVNKMRTSYVFACIHRQLLLFSFCAWSRTIILLSLIVHRN